MEAARFRSTTDMAATTAIKIAITVMLSLIRNFMKPSLLEPKNHSLNTHWTCSTTRLVVSQVLQNAPHFAVF
jgi:hypothetical protein